MVSTAPGGLGRPRVGVLSVQGAFAEHARMLEATGADPVNVREPGALAGLDAIVLPGGESTTLGLVARESGLLEPLRDLIAAGLPALGTCAGMIVLARDTTGGAQPLVGGMDIVVRRNAFGRQRSSFETALAVPALGSSRSRRCSSGRPGSRRRARASRCSPSAPGHAVAAREGELMVTAFHPELRGSAGSTNGSSRRARERRDGGVERRRDRVRAQ